MTATTDNTLNEGVSPELDKLAIALVDDALDALIEGQVFDVLLALEDESGNTARLAFSDDGLEVCLDAARKKVRELVASQGDSSLGIKAPTRYSLCYVGAIQDDEGFYGMVSHKHEAPAPLSARSSSAYLTALIVEFGEQGYKNYSGYSLLEGTGNDLSWTDLAPAGELDSLFD